MNSDEALGITIERSEVIRSKAGEWSCILKKLNEFVDVLDDGLVWSLSGDCGESTKSFATGVMQLTSSGFGRPGSRCGCGTFSRRTVREACWIWRAVDHGASSGAVNRSDEYRRHIGFETVVQGKARRSSLVGGFPGLGLWSR